jgi:ribonuclease VapC
MLASLRAASRTDANSRFTSGRLILEASMHLSTMLDLDPFIIETRIQALLDEAAISVVPINAGIAKRAVAAFARFGKGRGHPAQLNLADCMSYACAQAYRVPCCSRAMISRRPIFRWLDRDTARTWGFGQLTT